MATTKKPGVTKTNGEIKEGGVLIQNISIRPVERTQIDIQKYRQNHQYAESINGTRIALYDMYADMLIDGFLKRMVAKRILGVTKNVLKYVAKDGKLIEAVEPLLNSKTFRKLRQRIQLQKAWGISVIECSNINNQLFIFDIPKKHILPKEGLIIGEQYAIDGYQYRNPPYSRFVLEVGEYDDLGYLLEACAYVIYKRGAIADWANYAQIFGMPFREARYDGFNEQVRIQLEAALEKAGSAAYAVLPKDAEMKFHEASNSAGSTDLYNTLRKAMNEEIMVHILGATETTTSSDSSGYAQSETHKKTVDEVAQDDKADELAILNEDVKPILITLGLIPDGRFILDEPVDILEAGKKVDVALKLKNGGIPVSDDYFYDTTGIPKPDNYDELKAKLDADKQAERAAKSALLTNVPPKGKQAANADKKAKIDAEKKLAALLEKVESFFGEAL